MRFGFSLLVFGLALVVAGAFAVAASEGWSMLMACGTIGMMLGLWIAWGATRLVGPR